MSNLAQHRQVVNTADVVRLRGHDLSEGNEYDLIYLDADRLLGTPAPDRHWQVRGMIPADDVTLLGADGGDGKTTLALQLAYLTPRGLPWLGHETRPGPVIYFSAEEGKDELHYRLEQIAQGVTYEGKAHSLSLIPYPAADASLATFANGVLQATTLYYRLANLVAEKKASLLVLDAAADVFGGNEIDRVHVCAFIRLLRQLAIDNNCAVVLLAHPSVDGMKTGRGYSGSTHWNNAVRSRLYLTADRNDLDVRKLTIAKANRDRRGEEITLRWHDGCFVVENDADAVIAAKPLFLELLREYNRQGLRVSPKPSPTYAPRVFSKHPKGKGTSAKAFTRAMKSLLDENRIEVRQEGPRSRQRVRLFEGAQPTDSNPASNPP